MNRDWIRTQGRGGKRRVELGELDVVAISEGVGTGVAVHGFGGVWGA